MAAGDWPLKVRWSQNLCLIPFAKVNLSLTESNSNQLTSTKMAGCFYDLRLLSVTQDLDTCTLTSFAAQAVYFSMMSEKTQLE